MKHQNKIDRKTRLDNQSRNGERRWYGENETIHGRRRKTTPFPLLNDSFTLIELLVTIAIISILASLLLPALKRAKDSARKIACANNEKNFSHSIQFYVNDSECFLPYACGNTQLNFSSGSLWLYQIAPYMGDYPYSGKTYKDLTEIYYCPNVWKESQESSWQYFGYGWNYKYLGYLPMTMGSGADFNAPVNLKSLKRVSETICLGDTLDDHSDPSSSSQKYLYASEYPDLVGTRHFRGINVAFLDGHVEWRPWTYLVNNPELYQNK